MPNTNIREIKPYSFENDPFPWKRMGEGGAWSCRIPIIFEMKIQITGFPETQRINRLLLE